MLPGGVWTAPLGCAFLVWYQVRKVSFHARSLSIVENPFWITIAAPLPGLRQSLLVRRVGLDGRACGHPVETHKLPCSRASRAKSPWAVSGYGITSQKAQPCLWLAGPAHSPATNCIIGVGMTRCSAGSVLEARRQKSRHLSRQSCPPRAGNLVVQKHCGTGLGDNIPPPQKVQERRPRVSSILAPPSR
jgi:hypothetical protein